MSHDRAVLRRLNALAAAETAAVLSDPELLARFVASRDEEAFAALVHCYGPMVYRTCTRVLRHTQDAEDAFQATFLVLARKAQTIRRGQALGGFLHAVAHRIAVKARAAAARRGRREQAADVPRSADPEADIGWRELRGLLDEELARLPEKCRGPLVLCYLEGLTQDEAARQLGWSKNTFRRRLEYGRDLLRGRLARRGVTLSAGLCVPMLGEPAPAALPAGLVTSTVRVAGWPAGEAVSARVTALASTAIPKTAARLTFAAVLVLVLGAAVGAGILARPAGVEPPATSPPLPVEVNEVRRDALGDPLPQGALLRLGTLRCRHGGKLFCVRFSPDGKTVASAGWIETVRLWDVDTAREVRRFAVPQAGITDGRNVACSVAFSPDGRLLAAGTVRGPICLWEVATGKLLRELKGPPDWVGALAFSPDGETLASGGGLSEEPRAVRLWDVATGRERFRLVGHKAGVAAVAFSADGRTLASAGGDKTIRLWKAATGEPLRAFAGQPNYITSVAFSAGGGRGGATPPLLATGSYDHTVCLWSAATGELLRQLRGHESSVDTVAFSPDGRLLASGGGDETVRLWDPAAGVEVCRIGGHQGGVGSVAFSPDGRRLASGNANGMVRLWSVPPAGELLRLRGSEEGRKALAARAAGWSEEGVCGSAGHQAGVFAVTVSPDGKTIATGGADRTVRLWDAVTGEEKRRLTGHRDWVSCVAYSPDGKLLATGSNDNRVLVWDAATGERRHELLGRCVAFSPDGREGGETPPLLATGGSADSRGLIWLWDAATGKEVRRLHGHRALVFSVAFSPDGRTLASGGRGVLDGLGVLGEEHEVHTVRLWEVASGEQHLQFGGAFQDTFSVSFSPDGRTLATGDDQPRRADGGPIRLWEVATGAERASLKGHADRVWSVAFSPDGRTLLSASSDETARLWDPITRQELQRFTGHRGWVLAAAFAAGGRKFVTGGADTTALVWTVPRTPGPAPAVPLSAEKVMSLRDALGGPNAAQAYRAIGTLAASPGQALPLLRRCLAEVPPADPRRIARLVADLDHAAFEVREKAEGELGRLAEEAVPALREALAGRPALEVRRRVERLLDRQRRAGPSPPYLRMLRAVEALERAGTPEARRMLEEFSRGPATAPRTEAAGAALARLNRRPRPAP